MAPGVFEHLAQKIAQAGNHAYGCVALVLAHQASNRIEGIEQEMWLDLPAQCVELSFRELLVEARRFGLLQSELGSRIEQICDQQEHTIKNQIGKHSTIELVRPDLAKRIRSVRKRPGIQQGLPHCEPHGVDETNEAARWEV